MTTSDLMHNVRGYLSHEYNNRVLEHGVGDGMLAVMFGKPNVKGLELTATK